MVEVASIVVAVVSLISALLAICITTYFNTLTEEKTRERELRKFFAKYRDALLLATSDLQSRLCNITDYNVMDWYDCGGRQKESLLLYTSFVVGQYLCWIYIIRKQAQFLQYETDKKDYTKELTRAMTKVTGEFGVDDRENRSMPFMLWRGDQLSIGEIMLAAGPGEVAPIGYAEFCRRWTEDGKVPVVSGMEDDVGQTSQADGLWTGQFRPWFRPIIEGVARLAEAKRAQDRDETIAIPDERLRRLQHLLVDLMKVLVGPGDASERGNMGYAGRSGDRVPLSQLWVRVSEMRAYERGWQVRPRSSLVVKA
ncbi:hypothetical protein LTR62_008762 [Meristemomyces frigidus]|uniref:Uncharacterized protein n=1 Tax=Meristemomyces frigidus TaxID=1508187 RepID=A0AAN7THT8_9PEZI|nr:hypothetical protein LTR62_008762 [Meristemomyces frigidus]